MIARRDFGGTWIDVDHDVVTRTLGRDLIVERVRADGTLEHLWSVTCQEAPMFHRGAVAPDGTVAVVAKGNVSGAALLIRADGAVVIGSTNGNNPCAIWHDGTQFVVLWTETLGVLARLTCGNGEHTTSPIPAPWAGTSQGILDLGPAGEVLYSDAHRVETQAPWSFTKPNMRRGVRVGQWGISKHPELDRIIVGLPGGVVFTGILDTADDPRVSVLPSGRLLVAAYTPKGASLAIIDPPYPPAEQPPVVVAVPPPPPPLPPPTKEPPVSVPNLSRTLVDFHATWNNSAPITDDVSKARFVAAFAAAANAADGSGRWGQKARPGTAAIGKATLGYWLGTQVPTAPTDGKIHAFQIVSSDGHVSWDGRASTNDPGYNNIGARWFPVSGATTAPPPPPVDTGELARLRADNARLLAENGALRSDLATAVDASRANAAKVADLEAAQRVPSYDDTLRMIHSADDAFRSAQRARKKVALDPGACAHLTWGYLREQRSLDDILADAKERAQ